MAPYPGRVAGRIEHGSEAAAVRRSRALPLGWGTASDETLRRVLAAAATLTDRRRAPRPKDDARLRAVGTILLSLQVGRAARDWRALPVRRWGEPAGAPPQRGAVITDAGAYLVLPPFGSTGDGTTPSPSPSPFKPVSADIILPMSAPLRRVLDRLLPIGATEGVCKLGDAEDPEVRRLLRGDGEWRVRTTKAGRTLRAAENWLRHRLRVIPGGDPALSAMLDPDLRGAERTLACYATIAGDRFWELYRAALRPLDPAIPAHAPTATIGRCYGNPQCPADDAVRRAVVAFQWRINRTPPKSRAAKANAARAVIRRDHHVAMMMRCFIAVTFGTGQRGINHLVRLHEVDPDTGFAWVIEKSNPTNGYGGARAVFHPRAVRRHLAAYEDYLDALQAKLEGVAPDAARDLARLRRGQGLTFFDIDDHGRLARLSQHDLCRVAGAFGWSYSPNAGRHWLRSVLIGLVPPDALAAQFGHHLDGLDVWSEHSGLVPGKVAAALEPAIHEAMATIGLDALPASRRPHVPSFADPASATPNENRRYRAGQIIASAIWNGAMLDPSQEKSLMEGLCEAAARPALSDWIELERRERLDQQRWHLDATTRRLLDEHRAQGFTLAGAPDRVLAEFLGSDKRVADFRAVAAIRWRFRLPPILFAKAQGTLANHSLRNECFDPDRRGRIADYGKRPRHERRETCYALARSLHGYWRERDPLVWRRKRRTHSAMIAGLDTKPFYRGMTPLERSLARGLVEGLVADRGRDNARGYSAATQIGRAGRLWRHFVPVERAEWESQSIDRLPLDILLDKMPRGAAAHDVAHDLVTVLRALPQNDGSEAAMAALRNVVENYSVDILHPTEYRDLIVGTLDEAGDWIGPALALCYRTGLRFAELSAVVSARIVDDEAGPATVTLDHHQQRRLKTFHSRRVIPLDVLLDEDERAALRTLIEARPARPFPSYLPTHCPRIVDPLRKAAGSSMSVFPLRHAFATNALAALSWPDTGGDELAEFFDPFLHRRRRALRDRLCGSQSLGAIAPHALAVVMGHTSPHRTLFSYAHHLEVMVAAHVVAAATAKPALPLFAPCFRRTASVSRREAAASIGEACHGRRAA